LNKESRDALIAICVFILSVVLISSLDGLVLAYYAHATGLSLERAAVASTKVLLIVNELLFASLAVFFFVRILKRTFSELGLTTARFIRNAALGLVVGVGGWFVAVVLTFLLTRLVPYKIPEWFVEMLTAMSPLDLAIYLILTWVLIGPCEEIFFRGFIQGTFAAWKGPVVGLVVGSILFGLAHFDPVM